MGLHPIGGIGVPHYGCGCKNCSDARFFEGMYWEVAVSDSNSYGVSPGFIVGDWSVTYPVVEPYPASCGKPSDVFPALAMRNWPLLIRR
jgi:hypothetical protein